jgi:hypothetical protein
VNAHHDVPAGLAGGEGDGRGVLGAGERRAILVDGFPSGVHGGAAGDFVAAEAENLFGPLVALEGLNAGIEKNDAFVEGGEDGAIDVELLGFRTVLIHKARRGRGQHPPLHL